MDNACYRIPKMDSIPLTPSESDNPSNLIIINRKIYIIRTRPNYKRNHTFFSIYLRKGRVDLKKVSSITFDKWEYPPVSRNILFYLKIFNYYSHVIQIFLVQYSFSNLSKIFSTIFTEFFK